MRKIFFYATGIFWLAVIVVWAGGRGLPPAVVEVQVPSVERRVTLAELAGHSSEMDCWMAIDGSVYDLSSYLPDHPSKPTIILPWCGKEASQAYRTKTKGRPHSAEADQLLPRYRIGIFSG